MPPKPQFKKLTNNTKMCRKAGGISFSVILGVIGIIQTISMLIPVVVNWFRPMPSEPKMGTNPYWTEDVPQAKNSWNQKKDLPSPAYRTHEDHSVNSQNIILS